MDVYSDYNPILMDPNKNAKITYMTDARNFYYKVMYFSLKNKRATY